MIHEVVWLFPTHNVQLREILIAHDFYRVAADYLANNCATLKEYIISRRHFHDLHCLFSFRLLDDELHMMMRIDSTDFVHPPSNPEVIKLIGSNQRLITWMEDLVLTFDVFLLNAPPGMHVLEVSRYDSTLKTLRLVLAMAYRNVKVDLFPDRVRTSKVMRIMLHFTSGQAAEEAIKAYKVS